jgi:hypothetical protein
LSNLFGRRENADAQVREMRARIGAWRGKDNLVLISHGSTALSRGSAESNGGKSVRIFNGWTAVSPFARLNCHTVSRSSFWTQRRAG